MRSNRKFSVKRHIQNQHNGNASLVKFIEYIIGRENGKYQPSFYSSKTESIYTEKEKEKKAPFDIFEEEYYKEKARIIARRDLGLKY